MPCTACGTENRSGSRFCDNCGASLAVSCPSCGEANRSDARFCASCGATLATGVPSGGTGASDAVRAAATAERRLVSVLFADLVGFTSLAEDRDPEAVRDLLSRYFDAAAEVITLHGGTVEKFIGDAVMAVWGTPVAHEDDAERAVRAGLELVDAVRALHADLEARAGVVTGEAAVTLNASNQGMVAGDLVNTAARLQGVAEPGTVLVGEATMRAASGAIVFEALGDHSLKGKTAPVPAWCALRVVAARGGQGRADALEPPFVGRDEEMRQLKEVLHAVGRERRVRLVSITGPGGIGKSRLVWELEKYADGVAEDVYWHRGRSPSYGEGIAFWALGEMVRRRAGLTEDADEATTRERIRATVDEYVPDAAERERIAPALLTLLGVETAPEGGGDALFPAWRLLFERIAERGTAVLVFEDLQWADAGLLDFIDHLLDWSRALPILVVTLARPELFDRRPDWAAGRRHLTALALEPLSDDAMRELLNGVVPGLPEPALSAIVARAEGVPLYAVEMVRALLADGRIERSGDVYRPTADLSQLTVPDSLRSLIASRLDALDSSDRTMLQDAAVLGQVFAAEALSVVSGTAATELEPRLRGLVRRELLELESDPRSPERGQYRFVQSLIREVAYGTLARRDRRARHLAVARHYEATGDEELAGALAGHYLAAREASDPGPEADAVATQARLALTAAAERAAALGSPDQAVTYFEQALAITADLAERASLFESASRAATAAAHADAVRYEQAALDAYRELGDRAAVARAASRLGKALIDTGELAQAIEVLEAAVPDAEAVGDPSVLAETLANLSRAYMRSVEPEKSVAAADRALAIAERLNLDAVVAEAFVNKGSALDTLGRRRESVALLRAAVDLAGAHGASALDLRARNNLATALADDDPAGAMRMVLEALELARQVGDRGHFNWLAGNVLIGLYAQGRDWDAFLPIAHEALDAATLPNARARLTSLIGFLESSRGERLHQIPVELAGIVGDTTESDEIFMIRMSAAQAALLSGDPDESYRQAMALADLQVQDVEVPLLHALQSAIWARSLERVRAVAPRVADLPGTGASMQVQKVHCASALAALEGRTVEAIAGFRDARTTMLRLQQAFIAAVMAVDAAVLLPDEPEVRAWAAEARALLEELRARPYLDRLDEALASGARAPGEAATRSAARTVETSTA